MYPDAPTIDMTDITGTNCYCDDAAADLIRGRIFGSGSVHGDITSRIRFLDSGNYHYLSYFFMERIEVPFSLFLIDNHTDMQRPGFGNILSCGGWGAYAMENLSNLREVFMIGVGEEHLREAGPLPGNVRIMSKDEAGSGGTGEGLPVYLSIDKDALAPGYAAADWDQGDMTIDGLLELIHRIRGGHNLLGVDICGEKKESPTGEELQKNILVNAKVLEALRR